MKWQTAKWFLQHPRYLPQVFQLVRRRFAKEWENTREEALSWCEQHKLPKEEILERLGIKTGLLHPEAVFPEVYKWAKERMAECPYPMGGEGAVDFLYTVTKALKPRYVIETGVAYGWSSLAILLALKDQPNARLISIDMPYVNMENEPWIGCVVPLDLRNQWTLLRYPDLIGLPKALKLCSYQIHLAHYDSDKSYVGRMFAYPRLWKALVPGGLLISDDLQDNIAFKRFSESIQITPLVFEHYQKYVGVLQKPNYT